MRLIDADYAQEQLNIAEFECGVNFQTDCDHVRNFLNAHPTIDAVHVVRCKDCKHLVRKLGACYCYAWGHFNGAGEEGFCNYGERKEGDGNGNL